MAARRHFYFSLLFHSGLFKSLRLLNLSKVNQEFSDDENYSHKT